MEIVKRGEEELGKHLGEKIQAWTECIKKIETQKADIIYLFGAGNIGRIFCYYLRNCQSKEKVQKELNVAYADNSPELWGTELDGVSVVTPEKALEAQDAFFIVCSENYADEIYSQISEAGVKDSNIAVCDDMDSCIRLVMESNKSTYV